MSLAIRGNLRAILAACKAEIVLRTSFNADRVHLLGQAVTVMRGELVA